MSRQILNQIDVGLGIQESEESCIDKTLAEKIEHVYFDTSSDKVRLQKIMKDNSHPRNLASTKPMSSPLFWQIKKAFILPKTMW